MNGFYTSCFLTALAAISLSCSSDDDGPNKNGNPQVLNYSIVNIGSIRNDGSISGVGFLLDDGTDRIYVQQEGGLARVEFLTESFIDAEDEVVASGNVICDFVTDSDVVIKVTQGEKVITFKPVPNAISRVGHDLNHTPTSLEIVDIASQFTNSAKDAVNRPFTALQ